MMAREEYTRRVQQERQKAAAKYGPDALRLSGHPAKDIHDYLISELVGLDRYCEMLVARSKEIRALISTRRVSDACRRGEALGHRLRPLAEQLAIELINIRQDLRAAGLTLGETEDRS